MLILRPSKAGGALEVHRGLGDHLLASCSVAVLIGSAAAAYGGALAATRHFLLTLWWVTAGPPLWFARGAAQLLATV